MQDMQHQNDVVYGWHLLRSNYIVFPGFDGEPNNFMRIIMRSTYFLHAQDKLVRLRVLATKPVDQMSVDCRFFLTKFPQMGRIGRKQLMLI